MITEDYCSYEVAKLLDKMSLEMPFDMYVNKDNVFMTNHYACLTMEDYADRFHDEFIRTCTHQKAMKWLREKYDLHIIAYPYKAEYKGNVSTKWCCIVYKTYNQLGCEKYTNETLNSYEDAVEAAIRYSLENLI